VAVALLIPLVPPNRKAVLPLNQFVVLLLIVCFLLEPIFKKTMALKFFVKAGQFLYWAHVSPKKHQKQVLSCVL
jgi:Na+/H+ antiporter NhaD/arsenite permease-like protein